MFINTIICNSGAYHSSWVMTIGCSLSNSPAGIVIVTPVPSAEYTFNCLLR